MEIDIGPGAIDRGSSAASGNYTVVQLGNPANATGVLNSFEVYANSDLSKLKMGSFSGSDTSWAMRDYVTIGAVTSGSKQVFTGIECSVVSGDCLGTYYSGTGWIERTTSGEQGILRKLGDYFGDGTNTYTKVSGNADSYYATGVHIATVTTQEESAVTSTSLTGNGNITDTGGSGSDVTRRGFCYMEGTSGDPDANGTTLYAGEVVGSTANPSVALKAFTAVNCTGLTKANGVLKIDLKCDAPEKLSSSLGRQIELTSSGEADTNEWSIVPPLSEITASYKTFYLPLSGATTTGGELDVTAINFIRIYARSTDSSNITVSWRNAAILIGQTAVYDDGTFGTGSYTKSITGLTPDTSYRIRAYAVNAAGTAYGATVQAKTKTGTSFVSYAVIF